MKRNKIQFSRVFGALGVLCMLAAGIVYAADHSEEADALLRVPDTTTTAQETTVLQTEPTSAEPEQSVILDVPYLNQRESFPTGCESVSTVMAMQAAGVDMDVETFVSQYLTLGDAPTLAADGVRYGCDPDQAFPGDPRTTTGWGCFAPAIVRAASKALPCDDYLVEALYDESLSTLCSAYLDQGIPVIVWATIDMKAPYGGLSWIVPETGKTIQWVRPMHCLLLVGYDEDCYYFNDPWRTKACPYPKEAVEAAYAGMSRQAVVITKR